MNVVLSILKVEAPEGQETIIGDTDQEKATQFFNNYDWEAEYKALKESLDQNELPNNPPLIRLTRGKEILELSSYDEGKFSIEHSTRPGLSSLIFTMLVGGFQSTDKASREDVLSIIKLFFQEASKEIQRELKMIQQSSREDLGEYGKKYDVLSEQIFQKKIAIRDKKLTPYLNMVTWILVPVACIILLGLLQLLKLLNLSDGWTRLINWIGPVAFLSVFIYVFRTLYKKKIKKIHLTESEKI